MQIVDRRGTLVTVLRRTATGSLESAWVRIPDGSWLGIEPRATRDAPWGWSDRLWHAAEPPANGWQGARLTLFEAIDWARIDRIPALAEPARLPPGGGTAVLNLIAARAAEQGSGPLAYRGPYPTEQLFLALLESFRYEPDVSDPLAAFVAGGLTWRPAPCERLFAADGLYVQRRERIEKVVWRGITYYRPQWQGIARHAPRRIVDSPEGVRCGLWALARRVEDSLLLRADGDLDTILAREPAPSPSRPLPAAVWAGVAAVVAARGAAPLAPFVESVAQTFSFEWGPVARDLVQIGRGRVRISARLRAALAAALAAAPTAADRAALGLAVLTEMAALVGDALRGRAQAAIVALGTTEPPLTLSGRSAPADRGGAERARAITAAVEALLADLAGA
ncbi:MAG: hypothetical protein DMD87_04535 [Candidatus Rokuibacteriota bacterium]|nr:MAG: hypothetical protein DMD87_04535 [Candidatus Rokubacteria bacterium]